MENRHDRRNPSLNNVEDDADATAAEPARQENMSKPWILRSAVVKGDKLGEGSFSIVFRAKMEELSMALKESKTSSNVMEMFMKEMRALDALRHSNILEFYGCLLEPRLSILTEYCAGGTLFYEIHINNCAGRLSCSEKKLDAVEQILKAMEYIHQQHIVHGDLKSPNIFFGSGGKVIVGDLGLAAFKADMLKNVPDSKRPYGSILWMAPEVLNSKIINGEIPYTEQSDVYSFGVVVFEIGSGEYLGQDLDDCKSAILINLLATGKLVPEPKKMKDDCPEVLRECMPWCTLLDRTKRPTFKQLLGRFECETDTVMFNDDSVFDVDVGKPPEGFCYEEFLAQAFSNKSYLVDC